MNKIKLRDCQLNFNKLKNNICIATFGSYNETCFDKNRSDIDVKILTIN
ncbi:nucleotidyltransferase domain-containing protein, partial [Clostridium botulinum]|nr:nucleotidyltransferase domain-containing protein [Clostridium botulinum]